MDMHRLKFGTKNVITMWIWVLLIKRIQFILQTFLNSFKDPLSEWILSTLLKLNKNIAIRTSKIDGGKLIVSENRLSIVICLNQKILPIIIICYYKILSVILRIGWSCYHGNHKFYYKC